MEPKNAQLVGTPANCSNCEIWKTAATKWEEAAAGFQQAATKFQEVAETNRQTAQMWQGTAETWQRTATTWQGRAEQREVFGSKLPHEVLSVSEGASREEISIAYKEMAKRYHPDRVASLAPEFRDLAETRMKEINLAYHALLG